MSEKTGGEIRRMDDGAIREAMARAEKATPGPWEVKGDNRQAFAKSGMVANCAAQWADDDDEEGLERDHEMGMTNAKFVAAVRTDLPAVAAEALARGEEVAALRAEVERLTRERDEAKGNAERYAADIVRVMAQRDEARSRILADEERTKLTGDALHAEGEVAGLKRDFALAVKDRDTWREGYNRVAERMAAAESEVARLRAAALPEDAEERIARTCFEWDRGATWDERTNSDVENYTDQARAVLAALRGDA